jgi:DNA-binding transcriptional regulator LsrR (DeoR family)
VSDQADDTSEAHAELRETAEHLAETIRRAYKAGLSVEEIASQLGLGMTDVGRRIADA